MDIRLCTLCLFYLSSTASGEDVNSRKGNLISVFQVVKFKNDFCTGSTKNGTCFTSAECDNMGGTGDGTCADGFGVCCTVTITSGGSSSANNSIISLTSTIAQGGHQYTICPCNDNICRIKYDFTAFTLAGPHSGVGFWTDLGATAGPVSSGDMVGSCNVDTFSISSPCSGRGSPTICGVNTNQHMILDSCSTDCHVVTVGVGGTTSATRALDIQVIQYACGDEQGGPPGCLQYYENTSGKIRSFNFLDISAGTAISTGGPIHLANQHYKICMRRALNNEVICYIPCTDTAGNAPADNNAVIAQPSFGLSITASIIASGQTDSDCSTDYISIVLGQQASEFQAATNQQDTLTIVTLQPSKYCGRYLMTAGDVAFATQSICSFTTPFEVAVDFDDNEICSVNTSGNTCESIGKDATPGGSGNIGFSLCYIQFVPPVP